MAMEAPPLSTNSVRLDSAVKIEPNEVEMAIEIDDDILPILDYFPVSDSNGITVSGFTIFAAFKKLLLEIKTMKEQLASCVENQSLASQAIDKCSVLEEQVKAVKENVDKQQSKTQDQPEEAVIACHTSLRLDTDTDFEEGQVESRSVSEKQNDGAKREVGPDCLDGLCVQANKLTKLTKGRTHSVQVRDMEAGRERRKECKFCGKKVVELGVHMKTHTGEKPYGCAVCELAFTTSSNLKTHERIHNGVRPYKCSVCGRTFSQSHHLKGHERTHNGEKPYKCTVCDRTFIRSDNLKTHERNRHKHKCPYCDLRFVNFPSKLAHERIHTKCSNGDVKSATNPSTTGASPTEGHKHDQEYYAGVVNSEGRR